MQNPAPDSPGLYSRLALPVAGLVLALVFAASPAAADGLRLAGIDRPPLPFLNEPAPPPAARHWSVRPIVIDLRAGGPGGAAPFGLAVRLADGLSLGAAGSFDPADREGLGMISFTLDF